MNKSEADIYIPLNDTDIINLEVTEAYVPSTCETCDYGQNYIQDIRFEQQMTVVLRLSFKIQIIIPSVFQSLHNYY